jgi:hypothetical protein
MVQYQDPKPMVMIKRRSRSRPRRTRRPGRTRWFRHAWWSWRRTWWRPSCAGAPPPQVPPEELQKRLAEMQRNPPPLGTFAMHLSDYKKVDGIMLPHKIETSLDGEPNEEWTIEKYKVNPQIKADTGKRSSRISRSSELDS